MFFTQYLYEVVTTILCVQLFLQMYVHDDALRHLYEDPYTFIHLRLSLLKSLRSEFPLPSLYKSLLSKFLQLSLLVSLRNAIIRLYLLVSIGSNYALTSQLISLWKIFLQRLYDLPALIRYF